MARTSGIGRTALAAMCVVLSALATLAQERPIELRTNEADIATWAGSSSVAIGDPVTVFGAVMAQLPDRVQVYPTENYYYFRFIHNGVRYGGNIRLDAERRDHGEVSFSYNEQSTDWNDNPSGGHAVLGPVQGVTVEKLGPLLYRVTLSADRGGKSVSFALNDLSQVKPPAGFLATDETYIGPSFDESGIRFFLVFNTRWKVFHFLLDETQGVADQFKPFKESDRIVIGKRTGFAFYRWGERKILIGVSARQSRQNTYYDGPFDQLPENFIEGETLRDAIIASDLRAKGRIDRLGMYANGHSRFLIHPYLPYQQVKDLEVFHRCMTAKSVAKAEQPLCFVVDDNVAQRPNPLPMALMRR